MIWKQWSELSQWVWDFMRDAPFSPREETITESLIVEMARQNIPGSVIAKSTPVEERHRGHDWSWAILTSQGWVHLMVQAKKLRIEAAPRYPELAYDDGLDQAQRLVDAARGLGALPVYAFYNGPANGVEAAGAPVELEYGACGRHRLVRASFAGKAPWECGASPQGVALAHGQDVRDYVAGEGKAKTNRAEVNEHAMPWECFFCPWWQNGPRGPEVPGISRAATDLWSRRQGDSPDLGWLSAPSVPPRWAANVLELELQARGELADPELRAELDLGFWSDIPRNVSVVVVVLLEESRGLDVDLPGWRG